MRMFLCTVLVIWIFSFSLAGQIVTPTLRDKKIEAEIRRLYEAQSQGLIRGDVRLIERNFADDFVVTNPNNLFLNKEQVVDSVRSGRLAFSSYERQIEYFRVYGDTVIVAGTESGVSRGQTPPSGKMLRLRFTAVWRKQKGIWQQIARHVSILADPPGK